MPSTYWDYLKLEQLLSLQQGFESDESQIAPDELHFIVVHQTFELWFKLILRELRLGRDWLARPRVEEEVIPRVVHHLGRVSAILRLCVEQFQVMETLAPQDFLAFRDKLMPASGFQSFQWRELELILGLGPEQRLRYGSVDALTHLRQSAQQSPSGKLVLDRIRQAESESTLRQVLYQWLYRTPIQGSSPSEPEDPLVVDQFLTEYMQASADGSQRALGVLIEHLGPEQKAGLEARFEAQQKAMREFLLAKDWAEDERNFVRRCRAAVLFIESYRELPLLAWPRMLLDTVLELEEQMVLFRHRHARMVERVIGRRVGTGGSSGVEYLDKTAQYRLFPDLGMVRTILLERSQLPRIHHPGFYEFASQ